MEKIERIAVFGAGTMGLGIAQTAVQSGFDVYLFDVFSEMARQKNDNRSFKLVYHDVVQNFRNKLWLALFLAKGSDGLLFYQSIETVNQALNHVHFFDSSNLEPLAFVDFVIEAITENAEAKMKLYRAISEKVGPNVPITSNTSTIKIETLTQAVKNPERFCGMHFFNPVPRMQLVELIFSKFTNSETVTWTTFLAAALGKTHVIAPDIPGFIVNRVALPMVAATFKALGHGAVPEEIDKTFTSGCWFKNLDAIEIIKAMRDSVSSLVTETGCSLETINKAFRFGLNWPILASELNGVLTTPLDQLFGQEDKFKFKMGPFMFCDLVGNDVSLDALKSFQQQEPEKHRPIPPLLEKMVAEKKLGIKTGVGFYEHGPKVILENLGDGYYQIIFSNGKGNLLSSLVVRRLREILEALRNKKDIKVVFIGADGPINGADIKEFPLCLHSEELAQKAVNDFNGLLKTIEDFPAPVISLIRKRALGGGYELALACDLIIAEKDSIVGLPEITLGIMPGAGGTQRLPRRADLATAVEMILSGKSREVSPPLADFVFESQMTTNMLKSLVERFKLNKSENFPNYTGVNDSQYLSLFRSLKKSNQPMSFYLAWRTIVVGCEKTLKEGLSIERATILKVFETHDAEEGIRAFLEKRKPVFTGQ